MEDDIPLSELLKTTKAETIAVGIGVSVATIYNYVREGRRVYVKTLPNGSMSAYEIKLIGNAARAA